MIYNYSGVRFWSTHEWLNLPRFCPTCPKYSSFTWDPHVLSGPQAEGFLPWHSYLEQEGSCNFAWRSSPFKIVLGLESAAWLWRAVRSCCEVHPVGQGLSRMSLTHPGCQESFSLLSWPFLVGLVTARSPQFLFPSNSSWARWPLRSVFNLTFFLEAINIPGNNICQGGGKLGIGCLPSHSITRLQGTIDWSEQENFWAIDPQAHIMFEIGNVACQKKLAIYF